MLAVIRHYQALACARRYTERAMECRHIAVHSHGTERATLLNLADAWDIMASQQIIIADSEP